jgi:hypothetical protein
VAGDVCVSIPELGMFSLYRFNFFGLLNDTYI